MSRRVQLPPQIRKLTVTDRTSGKPVVRYQVTVDAGISPETGKRKQTRMRFTTEKDARDYLSTTQAGVAAGTYVARSKRTVRQVVDEWLASKHNLKPSTLLAVGEAAQGSRCSGRAAARRQAFVRDVDASAWGADRGDRGVAGARECGVHDGYLCALAGRSVEGCCGQFQSSCDNS